MTKLHERIPQLLLLLLIFLPPKLSEGQDTTTLMNYNLLNYPGSTPERHEALRKIVHYSNPDLVLVNELLSASGSATLLDSAFNRFGTTKYDTARFIDGTDTDNMLFYNSDLFGLASQDTIQTSLRKIDHYKVFYRDTGLGSIHTDTSYLHLYSLHLKASDNSSAEQQRDDEVTRLMKRIDQLPDSAEVIVVGDYNIYEPTSEPAWSTLRDPSYSNRLYDPLNTSSDWHNASQYSAIHTQSTMKSGCQSLPGGATGGMDDRFDLNLMDEDVLNGNGRFEFVPSSYRALGQDGQHFNECITANPQITIVPDSVVQSLFQMSDHLPVLMELHFDCEGGKVTSKDSTTICQGDTAWVGGNPFTVEGWAYDTTHFELSCNTLAGTYVDVIPVDTSVSKNGDALMAPSNGSSYQWVDCESGAPVSGADSSSFSPVQSGSYAVEVTQNGCVDRSGCHQVLLGSTGPGKGASGPAFKLYPDPGRNVLYVELSKQKDLKVRLLDFQGRVLRESRMEGKKNRFNTADMAPGVYLLELQDVESGEKRVKKWSKER